MLGARSWPGAAGLVVVLAVIVTIVVVLTGGREKHTTIPFKPAAHDKEDAPNVVVVMTDDQATDTMRAMPRTRHLVGRRGVRYPNSVVSFPLCCPSRATFLTGQYAHNHGVVDNDPPRGGYASLDAADTLPVWLSRAGYRTGFVGKFLNGYGKKGAAREVPPGWAEWYGIPTQAKQHPFNYKLNENGRLVSYGDRGRDYKTQVLADKASGFVRDHAGEDQPFFLWVATNTPHLDKSRPNSDRDPEPAPRDRGRFEGERPLAKRSVDEKDVSDKPQQVRNRPRLSVKQRREIDMVYVSQLESVIAIDRLVKQVIRELRRGGEFEDTIVVFTSDNGFLRGEHRFDSGKSRIYEEAIRVPLLIRGPGFPEGERDERVVGNVDLAPTILDLAGVSPGREIDGRSLVASANGSDDPRRAVLLEDYDSGGDRATGVRTRRYVYARQESGDVEMYDLRRDPEQLESVHDDPRYAEARATLAAELARLEDCAGAGCR